ncbi:hypothetical protein [Pseudotabrizicola formosa]|nr:hypothetical protein [Pseudotabrizicola formosa]
MSDMQNTVLRRLALAGLALACLAKELAKELVGGLAQLRPLRLPRARVGF